MPKYGKVIIANLAHELAEELKRLELANDMCIYYNQRRLNSVGYDEKLSWKLEQDDLYYPKDYCEYAFDKNILSFSTEGDLYDYYYNKCEFPKTVQAIFDKYDVYPECCTNWFFELCPSKSDWEDWDTSPGRNPNRTLPAIPLRIETGCNAPKELIAIKELYDALVSSTPDEGTCVLGAHIKFTLNEKLYAIYPPIYTQGCLTWERWNDKIIGLLKALGATGVYYNPGRMD